MKLYATRRAARKGLTLVEIMMAVLVLSIGLLGVLAAIPFGGFQMARMKDADYTAIVAKNAFSTITANGWHIPKRQYYGGTSSGFMWSSLDSGAYPSTGGTTYSGIVTTQSLFDDDEYDLSFPFLLDPLRSGLLKSNFYRPLAEPGVNSSYSCCDQSSHYWTRIIPTNLISSSVSSSGLFTDAHTRENYEQFFYTHDDILYGKTDAEKNGDFRPTVESETLLNNVSLSTYTGEYTWMALMKPNCSLEPFYACPWRDVESVETDVVVFKGRTDFDPLFYVAVPKTLYSGGLFELTVASNEVKQFRENLRNTKYLLLVGNDDTNKGTDTSGNPRRFAQWYRIASYKDTPAGSGNVVFSVYLNGPKCPERWNPNSTIFERSTEVFVNPTAVLFPGVCGVVTRTLPTSQP